MRRPFRLTEEIPKLEYLRDLAENDLDSLTAHKVTVLNYANNAFFDFAASRSENPDFAIAKQLTDEFELGDEMSGVNEIQMWSAAFLCGLVFKDADGNELRRIGYERMEESACKTVFLGENETVVGVRCRRFKKDPSQLLNF